MVAPTTNVVEDYFRENQGKNLSIRKISKKLGIKFKTGIFLANKSKKLAIVRPCDVGCGKRDMFICRFIEC